MVTFLLSMACVLNSFGVIWLAAKVNSNHQKKGGSNGFSE